MGLQLKTREAHERSTAAIEALREIGQVVNNQGMMLNSINQMVYELVQRQSVMEIVFNRYLESQDLKFDDILQDFMQEHEAKVAAEKAAAEVESDD